MGWLSRKLFGRFLPEKGNETKRRSITLKLLKHGFWLRTIHLTTFLGFCVGSIYAALGFAWKWPW